MAAGPAAEGAAATALAGAISGEGSGGASEAGERCCGMLSQDIMTMAVLASLHAPFCAAAVESLKLCMCRGRRGMHQLRPLHALFHLMIKLALNIRVLKLFSSLEKRHCHKGHQGMIASRRFSKREIEKVATLGGFVVELWT